MSGGYWNYTNDSLKNEIFGYSYDKKSALRANPFEDRLISELVWDVFDLLHAYDWFISGDTCEETYREAVQKFKHRWFGKLETKFIEDFVNEAFAQTRADLLQTLTWKGDADDEEAS